MQTSGSLEESKETLTREYHSPLALQRGAVYNGDPRAQHARAASRTSLPIEPWVRARSAKQDGK
jgi:hypothetical protein